MTFEIEIGGRLRTVTIDAVGAVVASGGRFRLTIRTDEDGARATELQTIDARYTDLGLSLIDGESRRSVDVAVTELSAGGMLIQLPHVDVPVVVDGRRYRRKDDAIAAGGEQRVSAPMPGRLLKVLVAPGDEVTAGQPLIVIEAMKMENELRATRPGRVREVLVAEQTSVEAGRLLVIVE